MIELNIINEQILTESYHLDLNISKHIRIWNRRWTFPNIRHCLLTNRQGQDSCDSPTVFSLFLRPRLDATPLSCNELCCTIQCRRMPKCVHSTLLRCTMPPWTALCKIQLSLKHVQLLVLFNYTLAPPLHCKLYLCTHGYVLNHPLHGTL